MNLVTILLLVGVASFCNGNKRLTQFADLLRDYLSGEDYGDGNGDGDGAQYQDSDYSQQLNGLVQDYSSGGSKGSGGKKCQISDSGLSSRDIDTVLRVHNTLRNKVATGNTKDQPEASNMNELEWDDSLQKDAQDVANRCKFQHYLAKNKNFDTVGQNLEMTSNKISTKNFTSAIYMWYYENEDYKADSSGEGLPFIFSEETGHYTQMVWATITHVGCGYVNYWASDYPDNHLYVCNYGPSGNVDDENVYLIGPAATQCKHGRSSQYRGLCGNAYY